MLLLTHNTIQNATISLWAGRRASHFDDVHDFALQPPHGTPHLSGAPEEGSTKEIMTTTSLAVTLLRLGLYWMDAGAASRTADMTCGYFLGLQYDDETVRIRASSCHRRLALPRQQGHAAPWELPQGRRLACAESAVETELLDDNADKLPTAATVVVAASDARNTPSTWRRSAASPEFWTSTTSRSRYVNIS